MEGLAVSASAWIVFIAAILIRRRLEKAQKVKKFQFYFVIPTFLTFIIGAALSEIILGEWLAAAFRGLADAVGGATGVPGGVWLSLAAAIGMFFIAVGLSDRQLDATERWLLTVLPTLFVAAAGSGVSGQGSQLVEAGLNLVTGGLGALIT